MPGSDCCVAYGMAPQRAMSANQVQRLVLRIDSLLACEDADYADIGTRKIPSWLW
jgi:hypothetical protein